MRHGLILWDDAILSSADVTARQARVQQALVAAGLDGLLIYTNHVRSGAVTWLTGFTPYWSDGILLLPASGRPLFATALSKRVGNWIGANNPSAEIVHSPRPGAALVERLGAQPDLKLGVVELDRMPGGLVAELGEGVTLSDASALFAEARGAGDAAEARIVAQCAGLAQKAVADLPASLCQEGAPTGNLTGALELSVRLAGAEEIYLAAAPDLAQDTGFAREVGKLPLGQRFALRLSLAWHGAWIRHIDTLSSVPAPDLEAARRFAETHLAALSAGPGLASALAALPLPEGITLVDWWLEAPTLTRPLQIVARQGREATADHAYGNLTLHLRSEAGAILIARPIGLHGGTA